MSATVLAYISQTTPWGVEESPAERAAHAVLLAVADFYVELHRCTTADEAIRLHRVIDEVLTSVDIASRAALDRAERLP